MQQALSFFRVRHVKPTPSDWFELLGTDAIDAAQEFHLSKTQGLYLPEHGASSGAWFSVIEVQGHGEIISRIFTAGIGRAGGVKPPHWVHSISEVERRLGVDAGSLADDNWAREESDWVPLGGTQDTRNLRRLHTV